MLEVDSHKSISNLLSLLTRNKTGLEEISLLRATQLNEEYNFLIILFGYFSNIKSTMQIETK